MRARRARARLVYDAHELYASFEADPPRLYRAAMLALERALARRADAVVTVSDPIADELVRTLGWPLEWHACMAHYASLSRAQVRDTFAAFCNARPSGRKFAHRVTDVPAGSSSSMKWVNPPVAYMLHAGVPRLIDAGVSLPGLGHSSTDPSRIALEGYPGLLARELLGPSPRSYKNDAKALQTPERLIARKDMLTALEHGQTRLGLRLKLTHAQRERLIDDATGDSLDAVLCLMQAAWAQQQHAAGHPRYGLPAVVDPLEGWIITA